MEGLKELVQKHADETGSAVAQQLLGNWEQSVTRFTEIMPSDYRLVLEAQQEAREEGLTEDETTIRMMEVAARA